jgi:hypothetical protein
VYLIPVCMQGVMGLMRRRRGAPARPRITAFSFGPQNLGWAAFTVLFLASDGGVYALCPVAPFGMRARAAMLRQLPGVNERGTVHTWLLVSPGADAAGACSHCQSTKDVHICSSKTHRGTRPAIRGIHLMFLLAYRVMRPSKTIPPA